MDTDQEQAGLAWQLGVWNRISDIYVREIDQRLAPVVDHVVARASLTAGQHILDLGTGTGAVAERVAQMVGPQGHVVGVDISPDMLALAQRRVAAGGLTNVRVELTVTDTSTGIPRTYVNPQGKQFQPIQDTGAFDACP